MFESNVSIEEFKNSAGTVFGPAEWLLIDQERIDQFAKATNDFQFIHVDPEKESAGAPGDCACSNRPLWELML